MSQNFQYTNKKILYNPKKGKIIMINPFEGISSTQKNKLLKLLETHTYNFNKNQEILYTIKNKNIICILLEGSAKIITINYIGEENLIEELYENSVFGTNISGLNNAEAQVRTLTTSKVLIIDFNKLIDNKNINYSYYNIFIVNLFKIIHSKLKESNDRTNILTQKSIRDKLLMYFKNEYRKNHSLEIYPEDTLKIIADYLALNRSAMFRELKNLKDEKFIKIDKKKITLLFRPTL